MTPANPDALADALAQAIYLSLHPGGNFEMARAGQSPGWMASDYLADELIAGPLAPLLADLQRVTAERDEAREVVARCNNSFGSYSYHLNPHPAEQIEKVKWQARSEWQRAEAAEARAAQLQAEVEALREALEHVKAWIDTDLPAGTSRAGTVHWVITTALETTALAARAATEEGSKPWPREPQPFSERGFDTLWIDEWRAKNGGSLGDGKKAHNEAIRAARAATAREGQADG